MEHIREAVLKCLDVYENDDRLIAGLNRIAQKEGKQSYPIIFHVLTNLAIAPEEAEFCWQQILSHYGSLCDMLARKVSLRTAICDYFCSIHKSLKNPKVVEIHVFEKTVKASRYDSLTGLYNRQSLDEALDREVKRAERHNLELSLLFLDLDDFKIVNDSYGHQVGDEVLKSVAEIIMTEKRTEDFAARYGGEEIVIILPETGKVNALVLGERIRRRVEGKRFKQNGHRFSVTLSGGLVSFPVNATDPKTLLKCADHAMYRAKGSGKNNISFFSEDKRRYLRVDLNKKIKVRELGFGENPTQIATGKNIGMGGVLFENDYPIPIDTTVQVNIPVTRRKNLLIIGRVVRLESFGPSKYDVGIAISFLEMDKAIKNEISQWLQVKRQQTQGMVS